MRTLYSIMAAILMSVAVSGCHNHSHGDEHEHEHEGHVHDATLALTAYGAHVEAFAEVTPLVVGEEQHIALHLTNLTDFKPIAEATVNVSLNVGGKAVKAEPTEAEGGIYRFELEPQTTGKGELVVAIQGSETLRMGVTVFDDEHEAHEAAEAVEHHADVAVKFTKEQSWKVDFATGECRPEPFGGVIKTVGRIEPSPSDQRVIVAAASGVLTYSRPVVEGQQVGAGTALFSIDASTTADDNLSVRLSRARSDYEFALQNYERKKTLAADRIVSEADLLEARRTYEAAKAEYEALQRNFAGGRQSVVSPIAGYITALYAGNGEYVEAGRQIAAVSQNRNLYITAEIQPKYYDELKNIVSANLRRLNSDTVYSLAELGGRMVSYGKSTSSGSALVPVVFEVANKADLLPGSFVDMYITLRSTTNCIAVPVDAVVEEMGNHFVFVQLTPELFEKREIALGATDGLRYQIVSGVKTGERIVTRGAVMVKLAQASGALDAHSGHVH